MADVLFGDYNPSCKLPISFPITEGQVPIYYNHYNTGRPAGLNNTKLNFIFGQSVWAQIQAKPLCGRALVYTGWNNYKIQPA